MEKASCPSHNPPAPVYRPLLPLLSPIPLPCPPLPPPSLAGWQGILKESLYVGGPYVGVPGRPKGQKGTFWRLQNRFLRAKTAFCAKMRFSAKNAK